MTVVRSTIGVEQALHDHVRTALPTDLDVYWLLVRRLQQHGHPGTRKLLEEPLAGLLALPKAILVLQRGGLTFRSTVIPGHAGHPPTAPAV